MLVNPSGEWQLGPDDFVASVVTPFREDERIDYTAWQTILETLVREGVRAVLAAGGEGEWHALSEEERVVVLRFCRQTLGGRALLAGNITAGSTLESVRLARAAESEGVDALVAIRPPEPSLTPEEWSAYLEDIRAAVRIPLLSAASLRLAGGANVAPRAYVERSRALAAARQEDASRLSALLEPLESLCSRHTPAAVIKEAMRIGGLAGGICRRPLGELSPSARALVREAVERLRAANCLPDLAAPSAA